MNRKSLFNKEGNNGKVINGLPSGIANFTKPAYEWSLKLYDLMLANTWFPQEISMSEDKRTYHTLTDPEKRMYDLVLSQLIFNDSVQTNNLADNINPYITDPIINACLVRQAYEESLHSRSYAVMVEDISKNTDEIYELWRTDSTLFSKNNYIAKVYQELAGNVTDEKLLFAMVANQILEGIYFMSGFVCMYVIGEKMKNSARMINFIHRDENTHLALFQNMINSLRNERPELFTQANIETIKDMFNEAAKIEIEWGKYITQDQILGLNGTMIDGYIKYLTNNRLKGIGIAPIYDDGKNTMHGIEKKWFTFNDQKSNFFESKVTNYAKGSLNLDDF